jgi:hypothetical protein
MISDATMSSPLFVPDSLKFYVNRLAFSKNRVRLQALSSDKASSGSQVIVRLPSNTLVNLASLTMTGAVRAYFKGADSATANGVALPTNFDFSFIETLSLIANGGIITQPFVNYKLLGSILNDLQCNNTMIEKRAALQGSLPQPIQSRGNALAPANQGGWVPFAINNWLSATQTMAPSYISTNLLGDLELRLTMADDSIVQYGAVADNSDSKTGTPSWEMEKINFYIETASIGNNLVDQAVAAKLAAGEPINVPFENVFSFSQVNQGSTFNQRFSVSSQSVNKILVTTQDNADTANGTQKKFINGIPQAFVRNSLQAQQAQFSVNNQYSPNYQIDSQIVGGWDPNGAAATLNGKNLQFSNALVETRAAMDIPDYDYDSPDMLCCTTQMPLEFFGAGPVAPASILSQLQPGSSQIYEDATAATTNILAKTITNQENFPVLVKVHGIPGAGDPLNTGRAALRAATGDAIDADKIDVGVILLLNTAQDLSGLDNAFVVRAVVGGAKQKRASSYWEPYVHKQPIDTYLEDKFVLATSFDFDVADKDRLVSGINTLGSNAQMFYNQIGADNTTMNTSSIFVLCTSMVQIYAGATLKIVQ